MSEGHFSWVEPLKPRGPNLFDNWLKSSAKTDGICCFSKVTERHLILQTSRFLGLRVRPQPKKAEFDVRLTFVTLCLSKPTLSTSDSGLRPREAKAISYRLLIHAPRASSTVSTRGTISSGAAITGSPSHLCMSAPFEGNGFGLARSERFDLL